MGLFLYRVNKYGWLFLRDESKFVSMPERHATEACADRELKVHAFLILRVDTVSGRI